MKSSLALMGVLLLTACTQPAIPQSSAQEPAQPQASIQEPIHAQEIPSKPKASGVWIDVRTPNEYQAGHLSDAVNAPVESIADDITGIVPDKNAPIHLYCRSGRRAEAARQILVELGYANVVNHGGYEVLKQQGYQ